MVYKMTRKNPFASDWDLRSQIRRAATSSMSNIAEGFERGGTKEFINFLGIAKGSVGEVESVLYVALDQEYVTENEFKEAKALAASTKRLMGGLMNYLRQTERKGVKYKRSDA